ncbi:cytochrome P450 [Pseudonocardia humida]|uniref:Cytochrome P450 n=1 Tax=Pseudonocardia humida TaxID=2800819 RepID=A0ABT1ABI1_9PSEU|nr:cytochrome P450 [Pseudonocardia humida]MCO1660384.1 cytochrome P450 [Pseudonocardia humida]
MRLPIIDRDPARLAARHEAAVLWASRPALFALLRAAPLAGPVRRVPRLGWVVTDPVLARAVLNDPGHFTLLGEGGVGHLWAQVLGDYVHRIFDGPGHADLRRRARDLFTDATARPLVARVFAPALEPAVDRLRAGGEVDVADLSRLLVGRMTAELLGLDPPDGGDRAFRELFATGERLARLALGSAASTALPPDVVAEAKAIIGELTRNVPRAFAQAPAGTLLGRCRELGLSEQEASGLSALLLVAGTETAATAMTRTLALLHDTGQQHRLVADPELLPAAVREGLRVTTPAPVIGRGVSRDVAVGPARMRAGERVLVLTYAANNRAGGFDLDRPYAPESRQLWFGAGRHLCLGAALARAELAHLVTGLLAAGPVRIVGRSAARGVLIPSYASLRVVTSSPRPRSSSASAGSPAPCGPR